MLKKLKRFIILTIVAFGAMSTSWVLFYEHMPVKWTPLMLKRAVENIGRRDIRMIARGWISKMFHRLWCVR